MKKWQLVVLIALVIISIYACIKCCIDPNWYFGKSLVPEYVTMDNFWDYVIRGER